MAVQGHIYVHVNWLIAGVLASFHEMVELILSVFGWISQNKNLFQILG